MAAHFILELCAIAALGFWGFAAGGERIARIALGIGAPLASAVVWSLLVAPKASVGASSPVRLVLVLAVSGCLRASSKSITRWIVRRMIVKFDAFFFPSKSRRTKVGSRPESWVS